MSEDVASSGFRLAVAQMTSTDEVSRNFAALRTNVESAIADRADLVVFPENALYFRICSDRPLEGPDWDGPEF
ncbi:MAG: hypothetical protein HC902_08115, partial [Calothrix sp. SM1_5_4]|nr:hypothetical protein [Calothrix sp. SM1_5_4]